jgi:hypothetical protein
MVAGDDNDAFSCSGFCKAAHFPFTFTWPHAARSTTMSILLLSCTLIISGIAASSVSLAAYRLAASALVACSGGRQRNGDHSSRDVAITTLPLLVTLFR